MKTGYQEIRDTCKLISYDLKLAGNGRLWVEAYRDSDYDYYALFPDLDDWGIMPMTITKNKLNEE